MTGSTKRPGVGRRLVTLTLAISLCFLACTAAFVSFSFHRSHMDTPSVGLPRGGPSVSMRAFGFHYQNDYLFGTASLQGDSDRARELLQRFDRGSRLDHFNDRYVHVTYNHGTRFIFVSRQYLLDTSIVASAATLVLCLTFAIVRSRMRERRRERLLCVQCAYPLRYASTRCPECGTAVSAPSQHYRHVAHLS